jgi:hypothetical protein
MHCDCHVRAATNLQHQLLDLQSSMRRMQLTHLNVMYDVLCAACAPSCCADGTMHPTHLCCKHVYVIRCGVGELQHRFHWVSLLEAVTPRPVQPWINAGRQGLMRAQQILDFAHIQMVPLLGCVCSQSLSSSGIRPASSLPLKVLLLADAATLGG